METLDAMLNLGAGLCRHHKTGGSRGSAVKAGWIKEKDAEETAMRCVSVRAR